MASIFQHQIDVVRNWWESIPLFDTVIVNSTVAFAERSGMNVNCRHVQSRWCQVGDKATKSDHGILNFSFNTSNGGSELCAATVEMTFTHTTKNSLSKSPTNIIHHYPPVLVGPAHVTETSSAQTLDPSVKASGFGVSLFKLEKKAKTKIDSTWSFKSKSCPSDYGSNDGNNNHLSLNLELKNDQDRLHYAERPISMVAVINTPPVGNLLEVSTKAEVEKSSWVSGLRVFRKWKTKVRPVSHKIKIGTGRSIGFQSLGDLYEYIGQDVNKQNLVTTPVNVPHSRPILQASGLQQLHA